MRYATACRGMKSRSSGAGHRHHSILIGGTEVDFWEKYFSLSACSPCHWLDPTSPLPLFDLFYSHVVYSKRTKSLTSPEL